jgi:hypothetical protein
MHTQGIASRARDAMVGRQEWGAREHENARTKGVLRRAPSGASFRRSGRLRARAGSPHRPTVFPFSIPLTYVQGVLARIAHPSGHCSGREALLPPISYTPSHQLPLLLLERQERARLYRDELRLAQDLGKVALFAVHQASLRNTRVP